MISKTVLIASIRATSESRRLPSSPVSIWSPLADRLAPGLSNPHPRHRHYRPREPLDMRGRKPGHHQGNHGLNRDAVRNEQRFGHPIVATPDEKAKGAVLIGRDRLSHRTNIPRTSCYRNATEISSTRQY